MLVHRLLYKWTEHGLYNNGPQGGSECIISVGDYVDNSFTALGSSDLREVRLEL